MYSVRFQIINLKQLVHVQVGKTNYNHCLSLSFTNLFNTKNSYTFLDLNQILTTKLSKLEISL